MKYANIEFQVQDNIAVIRMIRPEVANTISAEMAEEILNAATLCSGNHAIRAVILTGQGRFFCGGGDVKSFAVAGDGAATVQQRVITPLHAAVSRLARMNAPLITAVNGAAAGAGFSLAISGDIVIAAESAKLTLAYTKIGMSVDGGGSYFLPRLVGLQRAKELMLLNPVLTAHEALRRNLITYVVPDDQLTGKTWEIAKSLASGATRAYGEIKRLLADSFHNTLEQQLTLEARSMAELAYGTADAREGFTAFVTKRAPRFSGE